MFLKELWPQLLTGGLTNSREARLDRHQNHPVMLLPDNLSDDVTHVTFLISTVLKETLVPQCDSGDTEMICTWRGNLLKATSHFTLLWQQRCFPNVAQIVYLSPQQSVADVVLLCAQQEATSGSSTLQLSPVMLQMKRRVSLQLLPTAGSPDPPALVLDKTTLQSFSN